MVHRGQRQHRLCATQLCGPTMPHRFEAGLREEHSSRLGSRVVFLCNAGRCPSPRQSSYLLFENLDPCLPCLRRGSEPSVSIQSSLINFSSTEMFQNPVVRISQMDWKRNIDQPRGIEANE